MGAGLGIESVALHDRADLLQRLKVAAVIKPRVAGPDPTNAIRLHVVVQEPDTCVGGRLAGPEDSVGAVCLRGRR